MSTAHRPTWAPAQGKEGRVDTQQYSSRDLASHTKLKFRKPGQSSTSDISRRDLKRDLLLAEAKANKKSSDGDVAEVDAYKEEEERTKRIKLLQDVAKQDMDDDEEDENEEEETTETRERSTNGGNNIDADENGEDDDAEDDDDDDDEDDEDDEDDTAALLKELEKIKRERAEEKERQERERAANAEIDAETAAATSNPLLNLQAALSGSSDANSARSTGAASFSVKRRWDDDVVFKNQAQGVDEKPRKEFVNDLIRTEFHRKFLKRYIQ